MRDIVQYLFKKLNQFTHFLISSGHIQKISARKLQWLLFFKRSGRISLDTNTGKLVGNCFPVLLSNPNFSSNSKSLHEISRKMILQGSVHPQTKISCGYVKWSTGFFCGRLRKIELILAIFTEICHFRSRLFSEAGRQND